MDAVADPTKTELRAEILLARRTLAPEVHDAEAHALSVHLHALIDAGETVCAYVPVGTEPGSAELIDSLLRRGVRVLLPVARHDAGGPAGAAAVGRVPARRPGARRGSGCASPREPWLPADAIAAATVVLVPALAVDRAGVRLGRGAGFYDRSLPLAAPTARLVAVVRDDELVDRLPAEPHDVRMTHALTPRRRPGRARLAVVQYRCHRALLVRRDPQPVGGFDRNLPCDELAAERRVRR